MNVLWDGKKKMWIGVIYKYMFPHNAFEREFTNKTTFSFEHNKSHHIILGSGGEESQTKRGFIPLPFMEGVPRLTEPVYDFNYDYSNCQTFGRARIWSGSAPSSPPPPLYSETSMLY